MTGAYYNEKDPYAAQWLRNLIEAGKIAPGDVDERDIREVTPAELVRYTQCHFFAGIGIWSLAARQAGWPDERPFWSGSSPCQPFSGAGRKDGFADERHLWPHWHWLISNVRPELIVGEQVAGTDGLGWLDLVSDDMAGTGYAFGAVNISAAGFGLEWRGSAESERLERSLRDCPDPMVARHMAAFADWADQALAIGGFHVRQRLYFVGLGDADCPESQQPTGQGAGPDEKEKGGPHGQSERSGDAERLAYREGGGLGKQWGALEPGQGGYADRGSDASGGLADSPNRDGGSGECQAQEGVGPSRERGRRSPSGRPYSGLDDSLGERRRTRGNGNHGRDDRLEPGPAGAGGGPIAEGAGPPDGLRANADWVLCRDGFWRPVGPGLFPLAHAAPSRMGRLRAYGNGLDAEAETEFMRAVKADLQACGRW